MQSSQLYKCIYDSNDQNPYQFDIDNKHMAFRYS